MKIGNYSESKEQGGFDSVNNCSIENVTLIFPGSIMALDWKFNSANESRSSLSFEFDYRRA